MRQWLRSLLILGLPLSILAACGTDREPVSPVDTGLDLSGVATLCPGGDISQAINEIFPTADAIRKVAKVNCGQIFDAFGKGKLTESVQRAFAFFLKSLQQNDAGLLLVEGDEGEADIVALFILILTGIGVDDLDIAPEDLADAVRNGEAGAGELIPGGSFILPSKHSAMADPDGALSAPVTVVIFQIQPDEGEVEISSLSHPCPAGVVNSFDCYPLFYDYSITPESNMDPDIGLQLGQCNVSPEGVEVELLSPEGFLPVDAAPTGLDCTDVQPEEVAMTGWRGYAWAVLEPISPLLRVAPLFAGQNPVGGRISNFSPVAPADPESGTTATATAISPDDADLTGPATQVYEASVTEVPGGAPVDGGTVTFTVTDGVEFSDTFVADVVEGSAEVTVGCHDESGNIFVVNGNFTVTAEYSGTGTHEASSDPTPSTLSCTTVVIG